MAKSKRRATRSKPPAGRPRSGPPPSRSRPSVQQVEASERRARFRRRSLIALAVVLALVVAVAGEVWLHRMNGAERALLSEEPAASVAAGCGHVEVTKPYPDDQDRTHVGLGAAIPRLPALSTYPSTPPASGPHDPAPLGAGIYRSPPSIGQAIHSLEHSAVIVWYDPGTVAADDLGAMTSFFGRSDESNHVIVAPYNYPGQGDAGRLPSGRAMAMVAWHHVRYCDRLSLPVAFSFVHSYRFDAWQWGAYQGDAPERFAPI